MKTINKILIILLNIIKWIIIAGIIVFSVATFMGGSYLQTLILLLGATALAWWPGFLSRKWNKKTTNIFRVSFIVLSLVAGFTFFPPAPKTSIYLTEEHKEELYSVYDKMLKSWPKDTEEIFLNTEYGRVHLLACGNPDNPPLVMIHAASMGAHSWAENLEPLLSQYRIYSIDNIGEGNKSELSNALVYPLNSKEIADLYAIILDELEITSCPVFGASNGGFVAMSLANYYPEKVESLALFGPMGLTQLTNKSLMMLSLSTLYPFQFIRNYVMKWALGDDEYLIRKYGEWFDGIMRGTIPSVAAPVPMTTEQKNKMKLPVMLFLGTKDQIVGDAELAKETAMEFPNIDIEILESGHLIAVEHRDFVNKRVSEFLKLND